MRDIAGTDLLLAALREPETLGSLNDCGWGLLIRQAGHAGLLARVALLAESHGAAPKAARRHLDSALLRAAALQCEAWHELGMLRAALDREGLPLVLLKGAAYLVHGLPPSRGRMFSDIDILVPKASLAAAESALMRAGWMTTVTSAYDQRYYRRWMHELPPMRHVQRQSAVDVHHTIMPETARLRPSAAKLFEHLVDVPGHPGLRTLGPVDMVLHGATHLFHNDDLGRALRDLVDLEQLLRHFGRDERFWRELPLRAAELNLGRPLYLALRWSHRLLGLSLPPEGMEARAPGACTDLWMDTLWTRVLGNTHPSACRRGTGAALFLLYLRAHWQRMPPLLLLPHLAVKGWRRLGERTGTTSQAHSRQAPTP